MTVKLILKGVAMGIAEIIPGVSGGTIAFITGIYEKLLNSIEAFGPQLITNYKEGGVSTVLDRIDATFLLQLLIGMVCGIFIGLYAVTYLLENYPEPLWGFFMGLIIASSIYMIRSMDKHSIVSIILIALGALVAYLVTSMTPSHGNEGLLFVFFSGAIAICALILPGVSGSFILLMLGMYTIVIGNLKGLIESPSSSEMILMSVFALGCLIGLMTFSRLVSWTFIKYKNETTALLIGLMIGSLFKIWPWRIATKILNKDTSEIITSFNSDMLSSDHIKILSESNVLPTAYSGEPHLMLTILSFILGLAIVLVLGKGQRKLD